METKANYVVVGIFTLVAVLAAFGFVYWTATIGDRDEVAALRIYIPGSASGLGRGSAVLFNGVNVGSVRRVYLDPGDPTVVIADAEVDRQAPIRPSTRADVGLAGLTGQANVELKGGDSGERNLLDIAAEQGTIAEIQASPSAVANLLETAQSLLTRADSVIGEMEGFFSETRQPLTQTVENIERFSAALDRNADGIDSFLSNVSELSETLAGVSGRLDSTLVAAEDLIRAVDPEQVASSVENVERFTGRLDSATSDLEAIMADVNRAATSIAAFSDNANETLTRVDGIVQGVDPDDVDATLANFRKASTTVNRTAEEVARVSETVSGRTEDIDRFITDASELAERLNGASTRVDSVLAKLDGLLGSDDAQGAIAEASSTMEAFREVAETLNERIGPITEGLSRFSGQGLRDVEALVRDSRRSIGRIERAISSIERNPQRIITGGEGEVRRYDGRRRR